MLKNLTGSRVVMISQPHLARAILRTFISVYHGWNLAAMSISPICAAVRVNLRAACLQAVPRGHVTAVDFSSEMLAVARTSFGKDHSAEKVTFLLKDVMDLDLPDNSFDAIFMAYGIRNMPDYKRCLTNMLRLLKPGGRIIFHEYSLAENFLTRLYWNLIGFLLIIPFSWLLTGTVTIFQYLIKSVKEFPSPQKFRILLEEAGFTGINSMPLKSLAPPDSALFYCSQANIR